jgi:sulfotransferase family protein
MNLVRSVPRPLRRRVREGYTLLASLTAAWRPLPDYLVIGAARAGSTSLYEYLIKHPAILPALVKEVHFFTGAYERGPDWYRAHFPTALRRSIVARRHGDAVAGEATPYYLFDPRSPERIKSLLPNVRLIAVLRDPVQRAVSHYQHERRLGVEPLSLVEAIDAEDGRLAGAEDPARLDADRALGFRHQHFAYLARGRYAEQLQRFHDHFPADQLMVVRSEDLFDQADATYQEVLRFLGLPSWSLPRYARFNASRGMSLDAGLEARLRAYFEPHNARLERMLGREMGW